MVPEPAPAASPARWSRRAFLGGLAAGALLLSACGSPSPAAETAFDRRRIAYGRHRLQEGDLTVPLSGGPHPVTVLVHGGYWKPGLDRTSLTPLGESLSRHGYAVWNIDYRTIGVDGGGWPGTFEDVAAAIDHLAVMPAAAGLDLTRVVVMGHSAGGHLALWSATRGRPAGPASGPPDGEPAGTAPVGTALTLARPVVTITGVVSLAGVPDLAAAAATTGEGNARELRRAVVELLGGSPEDVPGRYAQASPHELLPLGVPQLLVHGSRDDRVPVQLSRDHVMAATTAGDRVRLVEVPTGDHGDVTRADRPAWPQVVAWLDELAGHTARAPSDHARVVRRTGPRRSGR